MVKGICLITLYYTDTNGVCLPVNLRLYDSTDGKTKNDYFQEMLTEVLACWLEPLWGTVDYWYSSLENLKFIRKNGLSMLFGMEKNLLFNGGFVCGHKQTSGPGFVYTKKLIEKSRQI